MGKVVTGAALLLLYLGAGHVLVKRARQKPGGEGIPCGLVPLLVWPVSLYQASRRASPGGAVLPDLPPQELQGVSVGGQVFVAPPKARETAAKAGALGFG